MRTGRLLTLVLGVVSLIAGAFVVTATPAMAAALTEVTGFGTNPTQLKMYVYRPNIVLAKPPIVVAVHYCHGDATSFYNGSEFGRLADKYGFLLIFPSVTQASDGCFDVASAQTLQHGAGGDSQGIVSMVNGVPFGCFAVNPDALRWSTVCATGTVTHTAQEWGDLVRNAYPGYTGARPRMQLWHGTADEVLNYVNFGEEIKQWTDVLGVSQTPVSTEQNAPQAGWTRTRYGTAGGTVAVEAVSMAGTSHNLPVQAADAIRFFGIDVAPPSASPTSAAPGTCSAAVTTGSRWATGFTATVAVTAGGFAITGWKITMVLASGTTIASAWNGKLTGTSGTVTVTNEVYNGSLAAGASTSFGFQASGADDAVTATCAVA